MKELTVSTEMGTDFLGNIKVVGNTVENNCYRVPIFY